MKKLVGEQISSILERIIVHNKMKLRNEKNKEEIYSRFQNPEPSETWVGIRPAKTFGNICPQKDGRRTVVGDEDCLFLNVYTPKLEFNSIPVSNLFNLFISKSLLIILKVE